MHVYFSADHAAHAPKSMLIRGRLAPCPETPQRADILLEAATRSGHEVLSPKAFDFDIVRRVHDPRHVDFMEQAWTMWAALPEHGDEILPNVHPGRNMQGSPSGIIGLAGHHQADTACPIGEGTWEAAKSSMHTALSAADEVMNGMDSAEHSPFAYALARPPGHHAYADQAGGFCYLNNTAVAAQYCRERGAAKIAILDVDVHHGNGTQGIFYHRSDILTVSLHGDPSNFYPFYAGYAGETGADDGQGFNLNHPLPYATADAQYLSTLEGALEAIGQYRPDVLIIALGLDASEHDGHQPFLQVTTAGFKRIGTVIGQVGLPTVLIQEGGYVSHCLGDNLSAVLDSFEAAR